MRLFFTTIIFALLPLCGLALAQRSPTTAPTRLNYREQYNVISERNIFLRDRHQRSYDNNRRNNDRPPASPEHGFVLTGIVLEDDEYRAYVEDVNRGSILKLRIGDAVARGKVAAILIDSITYEANGTQTWIDIGSNLTGSRVNSVSDARISAALTRTSAPVIQNAPLDPNSALSLVEQMRLRRLQQTQPNAAAMPATVPADQQQQEEPANQDNGNGGEQAIQPEPQQNQQVEPPQPAPAPPANPANSIEEQMRLRRAQQLGR